MPTVWVQQRLGRLIVVWRGLSPRLFNGAIGQVRPLKLHPPSGHLVLDEHEGHRGMDHAVEAQVPSNVRRIITRASLCAIHRRFSAA